MLGYTPFPKKIKYMTHSPLILIGSCKSILFFVFLKFDAKPKWADFHTVGLRIHHLNILIFFKPVILTKHSLWKQQNMNIGNQLYSVKIFREGSCY